MNSHALAVLEFDRVLDVVACRAASEEWAALCIMGAVYFVFRGG